jgi:hydrogenase-4 component B
MILFWTALVVAALSGVPGLLLPRRGAVLSAGLLVLSALCGLSASAWVLLGGASWTRALPAGPLGSAGAVTFDPVAAFFLVPVMVLSACGALFGVRYWEDHAENAPRLRVLLGLLTAFTGLLTAAAHMVTFLVAWEGMAIAAFFLVCTEDRAAETRKAGWIYLITTHAGTLCLFGAFALTASATGTMAFGPLPAGFAASPGGTAAFVLFLLAFGFKAGVLPLHYWLPGAHAAAPSHVSSFMSGVLIKTGILGMVRLLSWVPCPPLWWGGTWVALGALSGILGVALALGQHDLKRLLAYHSVENIGIILLGLGLGTLGKTTGHPAILVLGYAGAMLHVLNHALFKGLLFLSAGSVLHATGTRNLERMGGLAHGMPFTSGAFLVGAWAICGLPPLNGFVSELFIYLAAFRSLPLSRSPWPPLALASLALIGALALACFAKAYGIAFLGTARSAAARDAVESPAAMLRPLAFLAAACGVLGALPVLAAPALDRLLSAMTGVRGLPGLSGLARLPLLSALLLPLVGLAWWLHRWARARTSDRDVPTWDCGFVGGTPRIQYTASSFADGLVSGLKWVLWPTVRWRRITALFPPSRRFETHLPDPVLDRAGGPALDRLARQLERLRFLQGGHLPIYLLYVMLTLLLLLLGTAV